VVLGVKLVIEEVKVPVPIPSVVFVESEMFGVGDVDQTTPLAVIADPPSEVIFPPVVTTV
jgi:hypothetical protein